MQQKLYLQSYDKHNLTLMVISDIKRDDRFAIQKATIYSRGYMYISTRYPKLTFNSRNKLLLLIIRK